MKQNPMRGLLSKRRVMLAVLCLCCLWFTVLAAGNAVQISDACATVSLRYQQPIMPQAATAARRYAAQSKNATVFWPTYWTQTNEVVRGGFGEAAATGIWFSGDAGLVLPADFKSGSYPGMTDDTGVALSSALAWQLWGSTDAQGKTIEIAETNFIVRGVFDSEEALVLVSTGEADFATGWQAMALVVPSGIDRRQAALDYAAASGLGEPDALVDGPAIGEFAKTLAFLPMALLLLVASLWMLWCVMRRAKTWRGAVYFGIALAFALCLPALLALLPGRLIPGRWSDFAFWARVWETQMDSLKDFLAVGMYQDVQLKFKLLGQILLFVGSVFCIINATWLFTSRQTSGQISPNK